MKTREEVEDLKDNWLLDPIYDLEETEGFEDYRDELLAYRIDIEEKRAAYYERERIKRHFHDSAFATPAVLDGCDSVAVYANNGMSKREYFTALAMQAIISAAPGPMNVNFIAKRAQEVADATLLHLYNTLPNI
jgi:hypothetical protein